MRTQCLSRLTRLTAAIAVATAGLAASTASGQVLISQIWGGGSTTGAAPADTVELFNAGTTPVDLTGWSIQVATATGTAWTRIPIASGTIPAQGYFLVRIATGTSTVANGVAYDAVSTASDIIVSSSGKVALVDASNTATLTGAAPIGTTGTYPPSATAGIVDFVGYGTTAGSREVTTLPGTTANNAPPGSFTGPTSLIRRGTRCSDAGTTPDTNVNSTDFVQVTPIVWRNSSTAPLGQDFASAAATPTTPILPGTGTVTITGSVRQCASGSPNVAATSATANLSAIGLSSTAALTSSDGGLNWTGTFTVPGTAAAGTFTAPITFVTATGNRTASVSFQIAAGNDDCDPVFALTTANGPYAFTGTGFSVSSDLRVATSTAGNTPGTCTTATGTTTPAAAADLFYKFTPSQSLNYNLSMCGTPTWDSVLSVHTGCATSAANQVVCNDDGTCIGGVGLSALLNVPLAADTPYIIRVGAYTGTTNAGNTFSLVVSSDPLGTCCSPDGTTCSLITASTCASPNTFTAGNTCGANPCPAPAPGNDLCSGALNITALPYTSPTINLYGATGDVDVQCNATAAFETNNGVWFTYTPSSTVNLALNNTTGPDTVTAIFTGDCNALTEVACSDPSAFTYTGAQAGTTYYILVGLWASAPTTTNPNSLVFTLDSVILGACCNNTTGACTTVTAANCSTTTSTYQGNNTVCSPSPCPAQGSCCNPDTGACSITVQTACASPSVWTADVTTCTPNPCPQPPPPANDDCLSAAVAVVGINTGTVVNATNDGSSSCQLSAGRDVWHSFAPATSGAYGLSLCSTATSWDSVLSVHTACPGDTTNQIAGACDDDTCGTIGGLSQLNSVALDAGTTYYVRVAGWSTSVVGNSYSLEITALTSGACCNNNTGVCTITAPAGCSTTTSTYQGDNSVCSPNPCPPTGACCATAGTCTVTTAAGCTGTSAFQGVGTTCDTTVCPQPVACCFPNGVCVFTLPSNCTLANGTADVTGATSCAPTPCAGALTNSSCATAVPLTANTWLVGNNSLSSAGATLPAPTCQATSTAEVWFSYTAAVTDTHTVSTCGSTHDTILSVFTVGSCSDSATWTSIACDDDNCAGTEPTLIPLATVGSGTASLTGPLALTAGTTYYVRLSSWTTSAPTGGNYQIRVTAPQPANVVCCRGATCAVIAAADCTLSGPASGTQAVARPALTSCAGVSNTFSGCCYADYDKNGSRTIDDIFIYLNGWFANSPYTKVGGDGTGSRTIDDIFLFLNAWFGGCNP